MLRAGTNPSSYDKDTDGNTSLLFTLKTRSLIISQIVELLIHYEADPYIQNNNHQNAYNMLDKIRIYIGPDKYHKILYLLDSYEDIKEPDTDYII